VAGFAIGRRYGREASVERGGAAAAFTRNGASLAFPILAFLYEFLWPQRCRRTGPQAEADIGIGWTLSACGAHSRSFPSGP